MQGKSRPEGGAIFLRLGGEGGAAGGAERMFHVKHFGVRSRGNSRFRVGKAGSCGRGEKGVGGVKLLRTVGVVFIAFK
mgnify:CR=1 FL=1